MAENGLVEVTGKAKVAIADQQNVQTAVAATACHVPSAQPPPHYKKSPEIDNAVLFCFFVVIILVGVFRCFVVFFYIVCATRGKG